MRVVLAPDSFKGSLTAGEVCAAFARGARRADPGIELDWLPLGDGGEGTIDCLVQATAGNLVTLTVTGPLGSPVEAQLGLLGGGKIAVIESAQAAGLPLVAEDQRNPAVTTTYGIGELIRRALDLGVQQLIVCLGGTASQDAGAGMLQALGVRLLDAEGKSLRPGGLALRTLVDMDWSGLDARLADVDCRVACDVDTPLCGPQGTSHVFAPQKGATPELVRALSDAMDTFADVVKRTRAQDVALVAGGGAGGGIGAGVLAACPSARMERGIDLVMAAVQVADRIADADLVLTGEGRCDHQSVLGKTVSGVIQEARSAGVPAVVIAGSLGEGFEALYTTGLTAAFSIMDGPRTLAEAIADAPALLASTAEQVIRLVQTTMR